MYRIPNIIELSLIRNGYIITHEDFDATDVEEDEDEEVTNDYAQMAEDDNPADVEEESEDDEDEQVSNAQESEPEDTPAEGGDGEDVTGGTEGGEDTSEEGGDETNDYTNMSDDPEAEGDTEEGGDVPEGDDEVNPEGDVAMGDGISLDEKYKVFHLLQDYLALFKIVKEGSDKLADVQYIDRVKESVLTKTRHNIEQLKNYLFAYIQQSYDKNTYIENLTNYNFFTSALSIIIKMLDDTIELDIGQDQ